MAKRSTAGEFQLRIKEVQDLMLAGHQYSDIQEYGEKWNVSTRQIDDYITGARKKIEEVNQLNLQQNQALIANAFWNEYRTAKETRDRINALKEIAKIFGVGAQTLDINVSEKREFEALSDAELKALYERTKAARSSAN